MNAFIFKPSNESVGKIKIDNFDELLEKLAAFRASNSDFPEYSYIEASGKTWTIVSLDPLQLQEGRVTAPPVSLQSVTNPAGGINPKSSDVISRSVASRYRDGYLVARATTAIGSVVKNIGIGFGLFIAVSTFIVGSQNSSFGYFLVGGLFLGATVAVPLYVLGVLVSAHGQVLKATLDSAVHSSPFLNKEDMPKVMSL